MILETAHLEPSIMPFVAMDFESFDLTTKKSNQPIATRAEKSNRIDR